jgi:hypothetical protein
MIEALQVYARSPSSAMLMAAVTHQISRASSFVTEADGQELFRIVMAHPLEVVPRSSLQD